jgi:hypothetical protein
VIHDNHVYATVGFNQGCDLVKVSGDGGRLTAQMVYSTKDVQNRDGGVVLVGAHLFGHSEEIGWMCQEYKTGKVVWNEEKVLARGSVTFADGRLYCVAERGGAAALVEPSVDGWKEKGRLQLPQQSRKRPQSGGVWTHPVVANGRLYLRDQEFLFCFDVKK